MHQQDDRPSMSAQAEHRRSPYGARLVRLVSRPCSKLRMCLSRHDTATDGLMHVSAGLTAQVCSADFMRSPMISVLLRDPLAIAPVVVHGDVEHFVVEQRRRPLHRVDARLQRRHDHARRLVQLLLAEAAVRLEEAARLSAGGCLSAIERSAERRWAMRAPHSRHMATSLVGLSADQ